MAKRPRLSPSGPFLPQSPSQYGYVSRIWYETGPEIITNVVEGDPGPPGTSLVDIPMTLVAADIADLTWEAEGEVTYDILQGPTEDPRLFSILFTLGVQCPGMLTPSPRVTDRCDGWPHFNVADDGGNIWPTNRGIVHRVWSQATDASFVPGVNHVMLGLTFFGGGVPVHNAVVQINSAQLTVREYRGTTYTPPTP